MIAADVPAPGKCDECGREVGPTGTDLDVGGVRVRLCVDCTADLAAEIERHRRPPPRRRRS